jgi:nucleotide-binding universal stress UspA family protein
MKKLNQVLVAVDGSKQALDTARYAGRMLANSPARIVLFHVRLNVSEAFWDIGVNMANRHHMAEIRAWEYEQHKAEKAMLDEALQEMIRAGITRECIEVVAQPRKVGIARDILREALNGYDAVVIGRKGHSRMKGLVLGSVANKLIQRLRGVPLWIVGGDPDCGKLLVGMDSSEGAMRAVALVAATCNYPNCRQIYLVHVVRVVSDLPPAILARFKPDWANDIVKEASAAMQPAFASAIQSLEDAGFDRNRIQPKVIPGTESRAGALIQFAREEQIGSLVIGRRGLTPVEDFFMGRVGHKIVNTVRNRAVWIVS